LFSFCLLFCGLKSRRSREPAAACTGMASGTDRTTIAGEMQRKMLCVTNFRAKGSEPAHPYFVLTHSDEFDLRQHDYSTKSGGGIKINSCPVLRRRVAVYNGWRGSPAAVRDRAIVSTRTG